MSTALPQTMRAVVLQEYRGNLNDAIRGLQVSERPVPRPRRGQVLIRVEAAPCNPSDLLLLQGKYGALKKLPTVPGWEGAGVVVDSGGGLLARWLKGKRVACALSSDRDGTWAEYFVGNAKECIPLKPQISWDQAAGLIINPFTAVGLLETARNGGHRAAVQTAAASQLGRMIQRIAADANYPLIHVVRRAEQVELLKARGAKHVLDSLTDDFLPRLKTLCNELQATIAFDAISGNMTGTLLSAMPPGSTACVYGALSQEECGHIDPLDVVFREKTVNGFYLGNWLRRRGVIGILRAANRVQRMLIDGQIETTIQRRAGLDSVIDALQQYVDKMTRGKVLIMPHGQAQ
jgi:NADPH:quinone reductase